MSKRTYDLIYRAVPSCNYNICEARQGCIRNKLIIRTTDRSIAAFIFESGLTGLLLDQFSKQAPRAVARDGIDDIDKFSVQVY